MIVTLIPLFLAASVSVNENDWKYGAEVIYDARIDYVHYPEKDMGMFTTSNITTKLVCRSKSRLVLSCYFHKPEIAMSLVEGSSEPKNILNIPAGKEEVIVEDTFELSYETNGVVNFTISSLTKSSRVELIKALSGQLNVGGDLSGIRSDEFELLEVFTTGSCKTNYAVSAKSTNDNDIVDQYDNDPYNLTMLINKKTPNGAIKEILRIQNIDSCDYRTNDYFMSALGPRVNKKIISSKSLMTIAKRDFTSWTENSIVACTQWFGISTNNVMERITLNLDRIVPATEPLPTIVEPLVRSIFPRRMTSQLREEI